MSLKLSKSIAIDMMNPISQMLLRKLAGRLCLFNRVTIPSAEEMVPPPIKIN